jgi:hypothetical protein
MSMPQLPRLDLLLLGCDERHSTLDVAAEFDEIASVAQQISPDNRVRFEIKQRQRIRFAQLSRLLSDHPPHLLHISGHADDAGELAFAGEIIDPHQLAAVIVGAVPRVRCVVLNICNGERLAEILSEHVEVVTCMPGRIEDKAARVFAHAFYVALRGGKSVRASVDLGASESTVAPTLYAPAVDPNDLYAVDFAIDDRRIERRRGWLTDATAHFARMRPAELLLCHLGEQRPLSELLVPLEIVEVDRHGQLGIEPLTIVEAWDRSNGPLLITGEVGSGKTTTLNELANELAKRTSPEGTEPIPMMIPANELAAKRRQRAARLELSDLFTCDPGETHEIFLLVDAFDELTPSFWSWGERCVRELAESDFVARLVVTSRPQSTLPRDLFRRYQLRPWTDAHIEEFAHRWGSQAHGRLSELATGNPLTLTLACAYAQRVSGGLLALLGVVIRDLRNAWREPMSVPEPDELELEDCCLWLLLGPREKDPSVFPRSRFDPILAFLERKGLVCNGDEPIVPAGARWTIEYLAARACVRRDYDLERLGGRLNLGELTKVALALELELEPERGRIRLGRIFDLHRGRGAFRLRLAIRAARACILHGASLDPELTALAVDCLWRHVIDDCSRWKSPEAAEALEALCRANPTAAMRVRPLVRAVLDCSNDDATAELATRDGLLHISSRVRATTVFIRDPSSPDIGAFLHQQMLDEGYWDHTNVPVAAGQVFRQLPRTPELEPWLRDLASHLRHSSQSWSASAAVGLRPGEAPLEDLSIGIARLMELGQCTADVRADFLAAPGGLEAAKKIRTCMGVNGQFPTLADGPSVVHLGGPVPRYSIFVQRSCWQWLVPALGEDLADIARDKACGYNNTPAFTAVVRIARQRPDVLADVFDRARPWSLIVEQAANHTLRELVGRDERVLEALLGYLRRGIEAKVTGHVRIIEMLEPMLDRKPAHELFIGLLPLAWSSPMGAYRLPLALLERDEIATVAQEYAAYLIGEVEGDRLVPTGAAAPLVGAAWLHWQTTEVIRQHLEAWLERGAIHARLVASLLDDMPEPVLEAIHPALEAYLARAITRDNHEDALARQRIFQVLPRARLGVDAIARFEEYALAHAELGTTGSLAAVSALCRLVEPTRAKELATMAAERRLDACGFPDDDIHEHMQILAPLAPEAWLRVACQHPLGLRTATPIFEALFSTWDPMMCSSLAQVIWSQLQHCWTPYRAIHARDIVGQRPADRSQEWLYRHADVKSDACRCDPDMAELENDTSATIGGSTSLRAWEHLTEGHWFPRAEQQELLDMTLDADPRPILLLGGPGTGKSSLLRWLSDQLPAPDWHVLAIKSDAIPHTVMDEHSLCEWLDFGRTRLRRVLQQLVEKKRVCVIFDQLDALASTVDVQTSRLVILLHLLREASEIEGVQVVASTRHFELRYDPRLRKLGDQDKVRPLELGALSPETVAHHWEVFKKKPLDPEFVRARTPWAFRLMLALDDPESDDSKLLAAYWRRRVDAADVERQAELRALTEHLEARESLWSEPQPDASLDYWVERGVLTTMNGRYAFVHQSLFDYARAERIILDGALTRVVLDRQDGLAVRPLLRATLRVLRGLEPRQYSRTMDELWQTPDLRAHIRVLLVEHIGEQATPTPSEIEWMRAAIGYRKLGERGVRPAARSVVARSQMWFDELRATLRQLMSTDLGGELVGVLACAWAFEPATVERWLEEAWSSDESQVEWATEVLIRRKSWSETGIDLAVRLVNARMSDEQVGLLAYVLGKDAPEYEARLLGSYAVREWRAWSRHAEDEWGRDSPWRLGSGIDWMRAAKRNPAQYIDTIIHGLVRLARETTRDEPGRFRHDQHSFYTLTTQHEIDETDGVLLAIDTALATLAQIEREMFWAKVGQLESIDHDVIQALVLSAMEHVVEQDSARVVAFLLADSRRLLLMRALAAVLPRLAPQLDEDQAAQLWITIQATNLHNLDDCRNELRLSPECRRRLRNENEAHRVGLLEALAEAPLPSDAQAMMAQWRRRDDTEGIEPHAAQVYSIAFESPYDREQFARMPDADLLAALRRYPDNTWVSVGRSTEVTNERMCVELQAIAKQHGPRALALLAQLPSAGQFHAASALLEGAGEDLDVEPDDIVDAIANAWSRNFYVNLQFRSTCVRLLERWAHRLSDESRATALRIVDEALSLDWGASSDSHSDQPADAVPDNRPLFPSSSPAYGLPNIYSALRAAVQLRLDTGDSTGWAACLDLLEARLDQVPDASWRLLLPRGMWPGPALGWRWISWLARLFECRPGVLNTREGACEIWRVSSSVDESRMRGWLDALRSSPWPSGARAADELTTMLACWGEHRSWARVVLDEWLTNSLEDHEVGVVHGLVTVRNGSGSLAAVDGALVRFAKNATPTAVELLFDNLRRDGLRMTNEMLDLLLALQARNLPIPATVRASLVAGLVEFLDARPNEVARAARHIAASEPIGAGLRRDDHLISIAIGLHGKPEQRAIGMELFERWQEFDPGAARTMLEESDSAYWAGDDLAGVRSPSSRRPPLVLYATASPTDRPLDLERELKAVRQAIRDPSAFVHLPAVERAELITGLREHEPTMLVFSGHHDPETGLVLRGHHDGTRFHLPLEDLIQIISTTCGRIPILMLNTCSVDAARELSRVAGAVICSEQPVDDPPAREFLASFLDRLFRGHSVDSAFNDARLATEAPYSIEYGVGAGVRSSTIFEQRRRPTIT